MDISYAIGDTHEARLNDDVLKKLEEVSSEFQRKVQILSILHKLDFDILITYFPDVGGGWSVDFYNVDDPQGAKETMLGAGITAEEVERAELEEIHIDVPLSKSDTGGNA